LSAEVQTFSRRWEVPVSALPADGQYHRLSFEFDNPRQQALTLILDYPAATGLRADRLIVLPMP
jgi:hypothetical protein